jgi:hypothetical protein
MDGLTRDAKSVPDLFPRPAPLPGEPDTARLDLLSEPVQRAHRPQADRGIAGFKVRSLLGSNT